MADLRSWLEETDRADELKRYDGVDWDLEVGYLTARNWKKDNAPAVLFDKIQGYPEGYRILTSSIRTRSRIAAGTLHKEKDDPKMGRGGLIKEQ